jgi:4-amino-4-deoxy-L-arabinose transferase-like glycosyltransferase
VAFHLANALLGRPFYRAQHLGVALNYAQGSIDLMRPVIVGFNATGTPTAQEFPLWQALAALVFKVTGSTWYGWANLVSLVLFATGLWPLYQVARQYAGERAAAWAVCFFLAQPLVIVQAGYASTDGFSLMLTLWFLFFADRLVRTGSAWWWLATALAGTLAAVSKLPFFMAAGLCSVFMLVLNRARGWRPWVLLASCGAVAAVVFAVWSQYTYSLAAQAEYPYFELRPSHSQQILRWFFGTLQERLSLGLWLKGAWRILHGTLGSLLLAILPLAALLARGNRLAKLWLVAILASMLVFCPIVMGHWHYYLMCCPAVALLCGATLAHWEGLWTQQISRHWQRLVLAGAVLIAASVDGIIAMKVGIDYDRFPKTVSDVLVQHTQPGDKLVVYGEGAWGGEVLLRSGRQGLDVYYLDNPAESPTLKGLRELLGTPADLQRLKSLGYNKLVLLSESPVRTAALAVNPGSLRKRVYYPASVSPTVDAWPVVYRSDDLMIREIR